MPKIMVWNIQNLTADKLNDDRVRQHILENIYPSKLDDNYEERYQTPPDIFAVIELVYKKTQDDSFSPLKRGRLVDNELENKKANSSCTTTVESLLSLLRSQSESWCVVPPVFLADNSRANLVIAVFFRNNRVTFCGPGIWTAEGTAMMSGVDEVLSEPAVLPKNWLTGLQLDPKDSRTVHLPAYSQVNNDVEIEQRYLSSFVRFPEKMFPLTADKQWARSPVLVCFRENNDGKYNPEGRLINLLVWHGRSKFDRGVSDSVLQEHTNSLAFIANEIHKRSEDEKITIVAGDFNTGTVDLTTGERKTAVFEQFLKYGFDRHFTQIAEHQFSFHMTQGPTVISAIEKTVDNILSDEEIPPYLNPHLYTYFEGTHQPGLALDNVFTKGNVDNVSAWAIERVAGASYNDRMPTNPYKHDMVIDMPTFRAGFSGNKQEVPLWAQAFTHSENYGGIRGARIITDEYKENTTYLQREKRWNYDRKDRDVIQNQIEAQITNKKIEINTIKQNLFDASAEIGNIESNTALKDLLQREKGILDELSRFLIEIHEIETKIKSNSLEFSNLQQNMSASFGVYKDINSLLTAIENVAKSKSSDYRKALSIIKSNMGAREAYSESFENINAVIKNLKLSFGANPTFNNFDYVYVLIEHRRLLTTLDNLYDKLMDAHSDLAQLESSLTEKRKTKTELVIHNEAQKIQLYLQVSDEVAYAKKNFKSEQTIRKIFEQYETTLETLKDEFDAKYADIKRMIADIETNISNIDDKYARNREIIAGLESQDDQLRKQINSYRNIDQEIRKSILDLHNSHQTFFDKIRAAYKEKKFENKHSEAEGLLARISNILGDFHIKFAELEEILNALEVDAIYLIDSARDLQQELNKIEDEMQGYQTIMDELREQQKRYAEQLETLLSDLAELQEEKFVIKINSFIPDRNRPMYGASDHMAVVLNFD